MRQPELLGSMQIDVAHHHARTPGEFFAADEVGFEDIVVAQLLRCCPADGTECLQNALLEINAGSHDIERQNFERFEQHSSTSLSPLPLAAASIASEACRDTSRNFQNCHRRGCIL